MPQQDTKTVYMIPDSRGNTVPTYCPEAALRAIQRGLKVTEETRTVSGQPKYCRGCHKKH